MTQIDSQVWFQRIFHPSDFSDASNVAFIHALKLAVSANGRLTILHAGADGGGLQDFPGIRRTLERWEMLAPDSPKEAIFSVGEEDRFPEVVMSTRETWQWRKAYKQGDVERQILRAADECRADLIVMTTRRHDGLLDALRGSTTERIVRNSTCPVLALPACGNDQEQPQDSVVWRPAI